MMCRGHEANYYDVRDQRFLGDEGFVEEIEERIEGDREIAVPSPRAKLATLLPLVATAYGATVKDLVQGGTREEMGKGQVDAGLLRTRVGPGKRKRARQAVAPRSFRHQPAVLVVCLRRDEEKDAFVLQQLKS